MTTTSHRLAIVLCAVLLMAVAHDTYAAPPQAGIEAALAAAQETKRGITLSVGGQTIGGAVVKIDAGGVVELRGPQGSKITVRIDRIDAVTQP
ncbi:MAG: hypothetical protein ACKVQR_07935 [Aquabacterium sp.]